MCPTKVDSVIFKLIRINKLVSPPDHKGLVIGNTDSWHKQPSHQSRFEETSDVRYFYTLTWLKLFLSSTLLVVVHWCFFHTLSWPQAMIHHWWNWDHSSLLRNLWCHVDIAWLQHSARHLYYVSCGLGARLHTNLCVAGVITTNSPSGTGIKIKSRGKFALNLAIKVSQKVLLESATGIYKRMC